jgi:hypothetical protein
MITRENYEIWMIDYLEENLSSSEMDEMRDFLAVNPDIQEEIEGLEDINLSAPILKMNNKSALLKKELPCSPERLDHQLVALLEGDLESPEKEETLEWIAQFPEVAKMWTLVQKSQLEKQELVYADKGKVLVAEVIDMNLVEHQMIALVEGDLSGSQQATLEAKIALSDTLGSAYRLLNATKLQADETVVFSNKEDLYKTVVIPLFGYVRYAIAVAAAVLLGVFIWSNYSSNEGSQLANHQIDSRIRATVGNVLPVHAVSDVVSDNAPEKSNLPVEGFEAPVTFRDKIIVNDLDARFAAIIDSKEGSKVVQGNIQSIDYRKYSDEESLAVLTNNKFVDGVGGLAGVIVDKARSVMPQAMALTETPAAENAKAVWKNYREQKTGGAQVDKVDNVATNERILFKMGKLRISKKR